MYMISVVSDKSKNIFHQSNLQSRYGAETPMSRFHPTSEKGKTLVACCSTNIPTEINMKRGKEVI